MSVLSVCPPSSVTHVVAHPSLSHIPKQVVLGLNASVFSGLFVLGSLLAYIKIVQVTFRVGSSSPTSARTGPTRSWKMSAAKTCI